jgi:4-amino-4-deoxy-L-arabinose transferase-like glycosyltransferase
MTKQDSTQPQNTSSVFHQLFVPETESLLSTFTLGALILIAAILRFFLINQPIQYDEAYTFIHYASQSLTSILANYSAPNNHIFHTILVAMAYHLFGGSPWILRLPAFLAGVLMVPAAYLAARRFFANYLSLAAAASIVVTPILIKYSVNGRGYTLLALFTFLLTNFAGILVKKQTTVAWVAYGITAALGFYTIPIFLYPMAGISLWLVISYLVERSSWHDRLHKLVIFLLTCVLSGLLTLLLYSPVIFWGTGLASLVSNEIVESQSWTTFVANLSPRLTNTAFNWMTGIAPGFHPLLFGGFCLSLLFYRKVSNQRLPLQVFLVLGAFIFMLIQRVVPLFRIWLYLDAFYMLFSAVGLAWFINLILRVFFPPNLKEKILIILILLVPLTYLGYAFQGASIAILRAEDFPEEYAAAYIQQHIQLEDTIIALPPVDIQTAYYLAISGIPFDRFYQPDHPVEVENALVLLRDNSKYNTPLLVLKYFGLSRDFLISRARLVYEYGHLQVYSIPSRFFRK